MYSYSPPQVRTVRILRLLIALQNASHCRILGRKLSEQSKVKQSSGALLRTVVHIKSEP
jgi:hypothetical protein